MEENDHPPWRQLFWLRQPFPGKLPGEFPGNLSARPGNYPGNSMAAHPRSRGIPGRRTSRETPRGISRGINGKCISRETHFPGNSPGNTHRDQWHSAQGGHISNHGVFPAKRIWCAISRTTRYRRSYRGNVRRRCPFPTNSPVNRPDTPTPAAFYSIFWEFFDHLAASGLMRGRGYGSHFRPILSHRGCSSGILT